MTLAALDALFRGPLASYRERLVRYDDPRPGLAGTALRDPAALSECLARFARNYPDPEPRAVASVWSKHHFSALIPPTLAASLVLGRTLPVGLEAVEVVAGEDGRTLALKLRDEGPSGAPPVDRFASLIDGHLSPLVGALAAAAGLAPKVLWSNAGNVFDFVVRQARAFPLADTGGLDAARHLLASRRRADGAINPLFEPVRLVTVEGETRRRRRICCLRYLHREQSLCSTCPLTERPA